MRRPFYWNDLGEDAGPWDVRLYRVMATIGFGCVVAVYFLIVVLLVQAVIR